MLVGLEAEEKSKITVQMVTFCCIF